MFEDILKLQRVLTEALIKIQDLETEEAALLIEEAAYSIDDLALRLEQL